MSPEVSVIIPLYNAETWIARTIETVLGQSYSEIYLIVIDDGSTDASVEEVKKFGTALHLETGPNKGACHARNRGLALAREHGSQYAVFLDADDYFEGEIIAGSVEQALLHNADIVLSNMHIEYSDNTRNLRPLYSGEIQPDEFFAGWMNKDYVNPSAILWKVAFAEHVGGWDESLARAQDLEFTLRALLFNPLIRKNEQGAAIHSQVNLNSISRSQSQKALSSRFRAVSSLITRVQDTPFKKFVPQLHREVYHIARANFKAGYTDLGREIIMYLKHEGYREHPGTPLHSLIAGFIGLEKKIRLWRG